jgi:hypothetical protein
MQFDASIIQELRDLAGRGTPPSQLVPVAGHRLGLQDQNFRLMAVAYFREAFALGLGEAKVIGASSIFPDGPWTDAQLDKEVAPMIEETRHLWNVR